MGLPDTYTVKPGSIRAYFDALNKARLTKDPIDTSRMNAAGQDVADLLGLVGSGHARIGEDMKPVAFTLSVMFSIAPYVGPAVQSSRSTAKRLVTLMRDLESDARGMLALATGDPVEPRSLANDEAEDRMLGGS